MPFSWKTLGVEVRGWSKTLTVNYRTSHQIRQQADRLLETKVTDVDGNIDDRGKAVSVFNGPSPIVKTFNTEDAECEFVAETIKKWLSEGMVPQELAIFVRSDNEIARAIDALEKVSLPYPSLNEKMESLSTEASVCTMHLAKGLEFKAVVVMACDEDVIPSQSRIDEITDESDLAEVYATERQLLYVACTIARDRLLVTALYPGSEFFDDLAL